LKIRTPVYWVSAIQKLPITIICHSMERQGKTPRYESHMAGRRDQWLSYSKASIVFPWRLFIHQRGVCGIRSGSDELRVRLGRFRGLTVIITIRRLLVDVKALV
jgi:hypothetical protein